MYPPAGTLTVRAAVQVVVPGLVWISTFTAEAPRLRRWSVRLVKPEMRKGSEFWPAVTASFIQTLPWPVGEPQFSMSAMVPNQRLDWSFWARVLANLEASFLPMTILPLNMA